MKHSPTPWTMQGELDDIYDVNHRMIFVNTGLGAELREVNGLLAVNSPKLLEHLTNIVDAYGVGDGGKHVGRFIEEARPLVDQLNGSQRD